MACQRKLALFKRVIVRLFIAQFNAIIGVVHGALLLLNAVGYAHHPCHHEYSQVAETGQKEPFNA